ncbi:uncharacterized protein LOC127621849 [Xyrauchen texanus]|uniref:uncharacterized protein LOC127621849 n=1 Tax=Xyrauchen texanus TaxID=154827 RepID=UPI0022419A07|nr:uncharacterized protein LOC127621849 [Xyrauchen texanus]
MPRRLQARHCGPFKTFPEAPVAYGVLRGGHAAGVDETTSALAPDSSPETSMAPQHAPCDGHPRLPPNIQTLDRPLLSAWQEFPCPTVMIDTSKLVLGAVCNGHAAAGRWKRAPLRWHINCLELLTVFFALRRFLPLVLGKHILIRSDSTTAVAYINRQGGVRSRHVTTRPSQVVQLKSLHATHIPSNLNVVVDALSRQRLPSGEWRLHLQSVQLIWEWFGNAQVDLFASQETSHCPLWYAQTEAPFGADALAHSWPIGLRKYTFPTVSLLAQVLCKVREDEEQVTLVAPYWPTWAWFLDLVLLATAPPWQIPLRKEVPSFSGTGHALASRPRPLEHPRLAPGWDMEDLADLPPAIIDMI